MSERWRVARDARLIIRSWDGEAETVVYNEASGDTHLLDGVTAGVLAALRSAPADTAALTAALGADRPGEAITAALHALRAFGLVERAG